MATNYVGDLGLKIILDTEQNITGYSALIIRVKKPNGQLANWTGTIESASLGTFYYNTLAADLDVAGMWYLAAEVTFSAGTKFTGKTVQLEVKAVLG